VGELAEAIRGEGLRYITTLHHARNHYGHYGELKKHYPEVFENEDTAALYGHMPGDVFHDMWLAKLEEIIDRYQPDIIWFDSWLDRIPEAYRRRFAAYYLNAAEEWAREVVIVRKQNDLPLSLSVLDHEKTRESKISERAWMTDDTISTGSWCYTDTLKIKPSYKVIHALIDTVSKNGVVLLNISPKADGTIPEDQRQVLYDLGDWLEVNGEAIYATRPWEVFGEGPTVEPHSAHRNHGKFLALEYGNRDIRYTRGKDGKTLYAITMGWPEETVSFTALRVVDAAPGAKVELLGHPGELRYELGEDGRLVVHVPGLPETDRPSRFAHSFKLQGFNLTAAR
jgi:alpha-L-fucosidase